MARQFKGTINIDVRYSKADWEPYLPPQSKEGSPNVLYVVIDDSGIAAWDTFGGLIEMPNLGRIAKTGLRYSQWHTTALCSPTQSCLRTGRNGHMNSMACITEGANGWPGGSGVIPPQCGTVAEMLLEAGYNTYCVGKWHLTPDTESNMAGSKLTWPTGRGFERYYGFLRGETNNWYPDLVYDQHFVDQPATPEEGYHLSTDLVDKAIQFIQEGQQIAPDKPWLMYLAFGANHATHHGPKEWADKYKGKFDMGYEKYRELVLQNMKKLGIVPAETELSAINSWPSPEVYAGFSSHCDHQIGRLLDYLQASDQLDNTIIIVCSDNGASGEGGPSGSVNENKSFTILAEVTVDKPEAQGVIIAQGSRFGGHALFIKNKQLYYVYNFLGIEEQKFISSTAVPTGDLKVGVEFTKAGEIPKFVANGTVKVFINDQVVAEGKMRTQPGNFALCGEGLVVGRDSADAVSAEYKPPFDFTGGSIKQVTVNVSGEHLVALELEAQGAFARH